MNMEITLCSDEEISRFLNSHDDKASCLEMIKENRRRINKGKGEGTRGYSPKEVKDIIDGIAEPVREEGELGESLNEIWNSYQETEVQKLLTCRLYITGETGFFIIGVDEPENGEEFDHFTELEKNNLVQSMMSMIKNCARSLTPIDATREDAEDIEGICFEGFTRALNKYNKRAATISFQNYAFTTMTNAVRDYGRKEARRKKLPVTQLVLGDGTNDKDKEDDKPAQVVPGDEGEIKDAAQKAARDKFFDAVRKNLTGEEMYFVKSLYIERQTMIELSQTMHMPAKLLREYKAAVLEKMAMIADVYGFKAEDLLDI